MQRKSIDPKAEETKSQSNPPAQGTLSSWAGYIAAPIQYIATPVTASVSYLFGKKTQTEEEAITAFHMDPQKATSTLLIHFYTEYDFLTEADDTELKQMLANIKEQLDANRHPFLNYLSTKVLSKSDETNLANVTKVILKLDKHIALLKKSLIETYYPLLELNSQFAAHKSLSDLAKKVKQGIEKKYPTLIEICSSQAKLTTAPESSTALLIREAYELNEYLKARQSGAEPDEKAPKSEEKIAPKVEQPSKSIFGWNAINPVGLNKIGSGAKALLSIFHDSVTKPRDDKEEKKPVEPISKDKMDYLGHEYLKNKVADFIDEVLNEREFWNQQLRYKRFKGGSEVNHNEDKVIRVPRQIANMIRLNNTTSKGVWLRYVKNCATAGIENGPTRFRGLFTVRAYPTTATFYHAIMKLKPASTEPREFAKSVEEFIRVFEHNALFLDTLGLSHKIENLKSELNAHRPTGPVKKPQ